MDVENTEEWQFHSTNNIIYIYYILYGVTLKIVTRGNIVDWGGADVDNAFRGVTIYHITP